MRKKARKCIIISISAIAIFGVAMTCIKTYFNKTYIEPTSIEALLEKSDLCAFIDTTTLETARPIDTYHPNWPKGAETTEKDGKYYVDVFVSSSDNSKIKHGTVLTISQQQKAYIQPEKTYLVFLKRSETDANCCYIVDEPNGVIEVSPKLKPINPKMKDAVKKTFGASVYEWFNENVPYKYTEDKYSLLTDEEMLTYSYHEGIEYQEELKNEFFAESKVNTTSKTLDSTTLSPEL